MSAIRSKPSASNGSQAVGAAPRQLLSRRALPPGALCEAFLTAFAAFGTALLTLGRTLPRAAQLTDGDLADEVSATFGVHAVIDPEGMALEDE
jgi:hypothetical protein